MTPLPDRKYGGVGSLANYFLVNSKLTLILVIASILLGGFSVFFIAKEEEPQIVVPMIDVSVDAAGLSAKEVEREVTEKIERTMWGISGVEYIYSQSTKHRSLVTIRFKVNHSLDNSLLEVHHKLMDLKSALPADPKVESYSIDDVPFLILTFFSNTKSNYELRQAIAPLARELSSTVDLNKIELLGGQKRAVRIIANKQKLLNSGVSVLALENAIKNNQLILPAGKNLGSQTLFDIDVGGRFKNIEDVKNMALGYFAGRTVRIKDVADVIDGPEEVVRLSSIYENPTKNCHPPKRCQTPFSEKSEKSEKVSDTFLGKSAQNAVSISFSKRKGVNAVLLSNEIIKRAESFIKDSPEIKIAVMRDYGKSAKEKSDELILHLLVATILVSALIALFMGLRAASVIAIAIPVTLALTLFAFHFLDFTLNRVTLFALVFAIGILVDDAIVVVENIERHFRSDNDSNIKNTVIRAVSEIGGSTILATFAVIFAILPMAFVQGLMGPYMKPIPVGASFAMMFSLLVAFIVTPWAAARLLKKDHQSLSKNKVSFLDNLYSKIIHALLDCRKSAAKFLGFIALLLVVSCSLVYFKIVKVKMLPFDNKTEFQITLDYEPSTTLEKNHELTKKLAEELVKNPDILKVQIFSGQPAPFSFSGLVKHNFLRKNDYMSDLQIVLSDKHQRKISSHQIIENIRPIIKKFESENKAIAKVLEIPPGPPVMATVVAEIYAKDQNQRDKITGKIKEIFAREPSIVDLDSSLRKPREKLFYEFDYKNGGNLALSAAQVAASGKLLFSENKLGLLSDVSSPEEVAVNFVFPKEIRGEKKAFSSIKISSPQSGQINAEDVLKNPQIEETEVLNRKNLVPVNYVTAELSGDEEAPVYAISKLSKNMKDYETRFMKLPWQFENPIIKWDGEMFITLEVFRDLGTAFIFAIIAIYILILIKFKSFSLPIIIMAPIPISLIGVMFGHAILGSYFTATSMIGFMAGAGIIVRNSIILIDFIEQQMRAGTKLKEAVISAGILRFRPMLLTAAAVIFGSLVMLSDPIFSGFAISLIFGEIAATLLSRFVIPLLYFYAVGKRRQNALANEEFV